ncbi:MAG: hypothetical protein OXT01_14540 [Rhodospirillaceae bacterium]|nr:hypothetical protein [Rhodospirillaceae bacterium]
MMDGHRARHLSTEDFAHLGAGNLAYIKTAENQNERFYVLVSAIGQELVAAPSYEAVLAAAYERDLVVASLN